MRELGIQELTSRQMEELCCISEKAAREYVLSKVPSKSIETFDVSAEADGNKPLRISVDVAITLSPSMKNFDVQKLVDKAVEEALTSAEKYLRENACHTAK